MRENKDIITLFYKSIIDLMSKGSSKNYAYMVLRKFNIKNKKRYIFLKHVDLTSGIKIDKEINIQEPKEIGRYINEIIENLFSELFKKLFSKEVDSSLLVDLKLLGVDLEI